MLCAVRDVTDLMDRVSDAIATGRSLSAYVFTTDEVAEAAYLAGKGYRREAVSLSAGVAAESAVPYTA
jgi:hypothetical protein